MDNRIVATLICAAVAVVCNMVLLLIAVRTTSRYAPVAAIASIYGMLCSIVPAGAYIFHIIGGKP